MLFIHTYYSFLYGTLPPEQAVERARMSGHLAVAVTDINTTTAVFDVYRACQNKGMVCLPGVDVRTSDHIRRYTLLAPNIDAFEEINRFLSFYKKEEAETNQFLPPPHAPQFQNALVIYPWLDQGLPNQLEENEYIGIAPEQLTKLRVAKHSQKLKQRMIIYQLATAQTQREKNIHKLLRAVDNNVLISKLTDHRQMLPNEGFLPNSELQKAFADFPMIRHNTELMLGKCGFEFDLKSPKNKSLFTDSLYSDHLLLEKLALEGLERRYSSTHFEAKQRLYKELDIIAKEGFGSYFLITNDIVQYAKSEGMFHVGRGSGANSITAYCLGITDVDPIELDLYFERFLNIYRSSPPDFDLDFSWQDRDKVIQYMFNTYGEEHTCMLGSYNTFQERSIIRELGKVFGLPKMEIDAIVMGKQYQQEVERDEILDRILAYSKHIKNFPKHLSIHAGGVLITQEPIYRYTALDYPPKGFPITQFDMYVAEDIGLHKFDILSQRGLGHIKDAADLVEVRHKKKLDVHKIEEFKQNPKLNRMLEDSNTIGCFYIESPAMRQLIRKLKCNDYLTLVAASSIIRPGVSSSGMMQAYIECHNDPSKTQYIHPKMQELMQETYGIMVYQEDVIKVAHHFAGLSLAQADVLRRGMSGKYRSKNEIAKIKGTFFKNCQKKNYPEAITAEVWRQIESFSGYSFSKAHSASFAVESYQSMFLKAYYPLEFMTAVLNNFGGFYSTEFYLQEARNLGAEIQAPCINSSHYLNSLQGEATIFIGFIHIDSLERKTIDRILLERKQTGNFTSFLNFLDRVLISLEQVNILIRINAFRFTNIPKQTLYWEAVARIKKAKVIDEQQHQLFESPQIDFALPEPETDPFEQAFDEIDVLGFPLCNPFDLVEELPNNCILTQQMLKHKGKFVRMFGYLITVKTIRTRKGQYMQFGCLQDTHGQLFDTVHFPQEMEKQPFMGKGFYLIHGLITNEYGHYSLEAKGMIKIPMRKDERYA